MRVYNFSAGPAVLPEEVLKEAAAEMLDYRGCGMSVMEMSHRSKMYQNIFDEAEADIRELMNIPDNYKVLFMQGGASLQFAMVPMNLMKNRVADYLLTGQFSKKAYQEAKIFGQANAIASSADKAFSYIPDLTDLTSQTTSWLPSSATTSTGARTLPCGEAFRFRNTSDIRSLLITTQL